MQDVEVSNTIIEPPKACTLIAELNLFKFPDYGPPTVVIPTPGVPSTEPPPKACVLTLLAHARIIRVGM